MNLPQQTYYLVPGPAPGNNRLVPANVGNYGDGPEAPQYIDHYPTKSLQSQFAPAYNDYEGGVEHHVGAEEEEMMPVEPPKEKKRRRSRKQKKHKSVEADLENTTKTAFES